MMTTPEGQSMYADYLTEAASILEDTSGTNIEDYATLKTTYYYIDEYYNENGFPPQAPSNMLSVCYNNDFSMNSQSDTTLIGFTMYDGSSQYAPFSLCETEINWLPLPANSRPIFSEESNSAYRFNLNPNDNGNINGKPYSFFANFHSFELFEDETDYVIPNLVSAIPPSGRKSLKINNTHIKYHVNRLSKKFVVDQDIYYYSFASIMENPNGHGNQQPYFTVKLKQAETGSVLSSKCYVSDVNNPFFDWVPSVSGKSTAPITYRTWTCDTFNLMPYYGDTLQIDFIAADCAYGGHWGYVYLSDLCVPCSQQPSILLDSIGQGCIEDLKKIEGSLHIDSSIYTLINLSLNIYHNESIVDTISHTSSYNTVTGRFLFSIDDVKYNSLTPNTCFDIRAIATLLNPEGDTVTLKSVTANTNTATEFDNDFCTGVTCCPNDTIMVDIQGSECIGGEGVLQSIFNLHFSIDTADLTPGYEIPLDQPLVITGGYIDGFELKLINGDTIPKTV
ncbi:MAG: hypothetical protein J5I59_03210 [Saprospiraceae bacterium]|nr:hypothetical protein [Saprospiraceae bacterium]